MAGVKGRSGGARPNTGGARPGAGRKPKPKPETVVVPDVDMLEFLKKVAQGLIEATPIQVRAAIAAVQYTHTKTGDGGKKDALKEAAEQASTGRFKGKAPPLRVVG
jgi:phage terminase small subunit